MHHKESSQLIPLGIEALRIEGGVRAGFLRLSELGVVVGRGEKSWERLDGGNFYTRISLISLSCLNLSALNLTFPPLQGVSKTFRSVSHSHFILRERTAERNGETKKVITFLKVFYKY